MQRSSRREQRHWSQGKAGTPNATRDGAVREGVRTGAVHSVALCMSLEMRIWWPFTQAATSSHSEAPLTSRLAGESECCAADPGRGDDAGGLSGGSSPLPDEQGRLPVVSSRRPFQVSLGGGGGAGGTTVSSVPGRIVWERAGASGAECVMKRYQGRRASLAPPDGRLPRPPGEACRRGAAAPSESVGNTRCFRSTVSQ